MELGRKAKHSNIRTWFCCSSGSARRDEVHPAPRKQYRTCCRISSPRGEGTGKVRNKEPEAAQSLQDSPTEAALLL